MGQDKLLELRQTQFRWNPLPALKISHFNRQSIEMVRTSTGKIRNRRSQRRKDRFGPAGKPATSSKPMLVLLEDAGLRVHRAEQTLTARAADTFIARALEVPIGAALLSVQRVATERSGRPVQYLIGHYRPDHYEYRMALSRTGEETRVWVDSNPGEDK